MNQETSIFPSFYYFFFLSTYADRGYPAESIKLLFKNFLLFL